MRRSVVVGAIGLAGAVALTVAGTLYLHGRALRIEQILAAYDARAEYGRIVISQPFDGAVFPPEMPAPVFQWEDPDVASDGWIVSFRFADGGEGLDFATKTTAWSPADETWETIKRRSQEHSVQVTILGVNCAQQDRPRSAALLSLQTSTDPVGAPIFYREVNLPFIEAVADPSRIRWRIGTVSSQQPPHVLLEGLPVCGNCHSFSADGRTMGMDIDYANDKGSYAIMPVASQMLLEPSRIISWSQYQPEDGQATFGLLSQVSPDGRYVVSTVKDESVFVPRPDIAFSQLFFPIKGILAIYCRETNCFQSLPGADDPAYVQSNPVWSPDGKYLVFARSKVHRLKHESARTSVLLTEEECAEFLHEGATFRFDLYRIAFNEGRGGVPEPLEGAAHNGYSNYFPRFSPDGKWLVFCRSKSFMLLQPDSELYLMPASGGAARRLRCNTSRMNSWHSWSPNGKWLVFASKALSDYTQLFLTHVDETGETSPPVVLSHFTSSDRAANIPEFVNIAANGIDRIQERYLTDYSYARASQTRLFTGNVQQAEESARKALELNPKSSVALCNLGIALDEQGRSKEAEVCFRDAIRYDPDSFLGHLNLGSFLGRQGEIAQGLDHLRRAVELAPNRMEARLMLGVGLVETRRFAEAAEHLDVVAQSSPENVLAQSYLGLALQGQGKSGAALPRFTAALQHDPDCVPALLGAATIRATAKESELRHAGEAVRLAQHACTVTGPRNSEALMVLAEALFAAGRRDDAVTTALQALNNARATGRADHAAALEQSLRRYAGKAPSSPPKRKP